MKHILSALLIFTILFSFAACGNVSENTSEHSEESQPNGGFTLSASMIKYPTDQNVADTSVKAEITSYVAEKKVAPAERIYKKSDSEEIVLSYGSTYEEKCANEISHVDVYTDNYGCFYYFDNKTGKSLGYDSRSKDYDHIIYFDDEEFLEKADDVASAFVDVSKYEIIHERFDTCNGHEKFAYNRIYKKYLNGIPTTEGIICVVYADGTTAYMPKNVGLFDNIVAPDIDFDELTQYATEKAGDLLTDPPEGWYVDYDSIKTYSYFYHLNSSGKLELHFSFWYDLIAINSDDPYPHPWHNGMRMVIVFD